MAKAQINGNNVEVTSTVVNGAVTYTLSGKDAEKLHDTLEDVGAHPSDMKAGQFTISKSDLIDPNKNVPFLRIVDKKLGAALSIH